MPSLHESGHQIQYIIDPHHIFVNNRAKACSSGLNQVGARKVARVKVGKKTVKKMILILPLNWLKNFEIGRETPMQLQLLARKWKRR